MTLKNPNDRFGINPEIDLTKLHDWILRNTGKDLNEQTVSYILGTAKK